LYILLYIFLLGGGLVDSPRLGLRRGWGLMRPQKKHRIETVCWWRKIKLGLLIVIKLRLVERVGFLGGVEWVILLIILLLIPRVLR